MIFDANTFGPDEVPVEITDSNGLKYGYSEYVLIDVCGERDASSYHIGWFDHDESEWRFKDESHRPVHFNEAEYLGLHWSFLPLAIYETNPELRKTVKI